MKSRRLERENVKKVKIFGRKNFIWLAGVILAVAVVNESTFEVLKQNEYFGFVRELVIVIMAICSLVFTPKALRHSNNFSWGPIEEVAYLFLGIFITMVPCILYLETHAREIGVNTANLFYYSAGSLSAFLDNTPTAVTFYSLAEGLVRDNPLLLQDTSVVAGIPALLMKAICSGAVFFGSLSYIGNGPNFMVKAIAESNGVEMPHFFAYMYKFSLIVLLPLFILCQLLFL